MKTEEVKQELLKQIVEGDRYQLELVRDKVGLIEEAGLLPSEA